MPSKKGGPVSVPEAYRGREQSYIKHELLRAYLKRLFLIVGMGAHRLGVDELCYVDCFAGPWQDESNDLGGTSIAISLQILDECRAELERQGRPVRIRALYVERDKPAFARLERYLQEHTPARIEAAAMEGDFVAMRPAILDWCGTNAFAFFYIDPKGWKPVGVAVLRPLLARPRSEFLITFMYEFVNRFAEELKEHMVELLGEVPDIQTLNSAAREKRLLHLYRQHTKALLPANQKWPARSAYVRVLDRQKDRTKYHLVYLTSHPHGVIVFMEISEKLESVQRQVRAETKQAARIAKSRQSELFGAAELVDQPENQIEASDVERYWIAKLSAQAKKIGEVEFADMLEETDWFPSDLQRALGNLIRTGKVRNLDAPRRRRTRFVHLEHGGEHLQLVKDIK